MKTMLSVGIDITAAQYGRGVSRYTTNLVKALVATQAVDVQLYGVSWGNYHQLTALASQLLKPDKATTPRRTKIAIHQRPIALQQALWSNFNWPPVKRSLPSIDVFHSWDWIQPPDKDLPLVSTVHDLAILHFPESAQPKVVAMHQQAWRKFQSSQAQLIAVSHSTKRDLVEKLQIDPTRITVIYEALPVEIIKTMDAITEDQYVLVKQKLGLNKPFILFVGTREPRKNLSRLVKAWAPLRASVDLLIAGESGWDSTQAWTPYVQDGTLRLLGKVSEQELAVLYEETEALVYPCLYEGFGLPILEAFYHGTPVVTSDGSGMKEVAGNAAVLVDPLSIASIQTGIENILNESLSDQKKRLQKMILRLQLFSWPKVAKETLAVYHLAYQQSL